MRVKKESELFRTVVFILGVSKFFFFIFSALDTQSPEQDGRIRK